MSDLISRQAAIDAYGDWYVEEGTEEGFIGTVKQLLEGLPSAPEITLESAIKYLHSIGWMQEHDRILTVDRDIPKKPNEVIDKAWGIPNRQAVCPNCDSYLGTIHFICGGDKRKISYCESCGQAIDWEGWEEDD